MTSARGYVRGGLALAGSMASLFGPARDDHPTADLALRLRRSRYQRCASCDPTATSGTKRP